MNTYNQLVRELNFAQTIILKMLKHMTVAQKNAAAIEIEEANAGGEGMTRHHERAAVLASAKQMKSPDINDAMQLYSNKDVRIDFSQDESNASKGEATPVFCKDCAHHDGRRMARCTASQVRRTDLVNGYYGPYCQAERSDSRLCGPEGRLFQMRQFPSDSKRSSLSSRNRASSAISPSTAATSASEGSSP